jgi:TolB-like protein/Flp pilus assembly protein TadD
MIGQTISHYRILKKLGEGGMGVVYKAEDIKLKRTVALKFLPPESTRDPEAKARFIHEAQAASALDHPNVCTIHEIDETEDGQLFLAMARYEGETLKERIARGPLPLDDALDITRQIAEGLAKAHEQEIVHRDIKPANIFVTTDRLVKILDFGLAKLAGQTRITRAGTTLGTVAYMSPEQARGGETDARTDLWSLGVVLYEMMVGCRPFQGETQAAVVSAMQTSDPEPVTSRRTGVPTNIDLVIAKCLEKDPADRYATAEDLNVDLRRLLRMCTGSGRTQILAGPKKQGRAILRFAPAIGGGLIVLLATLMILNVGGIQNHLTRGTTTGQITSLAVLPLENMMNDPDQEYFVAGMHEALITELSKIASLTVISRTSTMRYAAANKSVPEIARELGADGIVEGSVLRSGGRIRITAQLIDGRRDRHLWADNFDRDLKDVFTLQSEVASAIAREIQATVTQDESARLTGPGSIDPDVYEAYLQGRYLAGAENVESRLKSREYYTRAIDLDSTFAPAYAGLGLTYSLAPGAFTGLSLEKAYAKAERLIRKALQIDPNLASAHFALAEVLFEHHWDWSGAEREYRQALQLDPSYASAHSGYSEFLSAMGRHEEAISHAQRAYRLSPGTPGAGSCAGYAYFYARRYDDAVAHLQKILELNPNYSRTHFGLGHALLELGRVDEAIREYEIADELTGWGTNFYTARAYAVAGRRDDALAVLQAMESSYAKQESVRPGRIAIVHVALGNIDEAFYWLEKAYEERYFGFAFFKIAPYWDPLHDDPRYVSLLRRIGLDSE